MHPLVFAFAVLTALAPGARGAHFSFSSSITAGARFALPAVTGGCQTCPGTFLPRMMPDAHCYGAILPPTVRRPKRISGAGRG